MASRSSSISDEIDLDLSASSSSFEEEEVRQYEDVEEGPDEEPIRGNLPYQFEPLAEVVADVAEPGADEQAVAAAGGDGEPVARRDNLAW
ncbi:hypothetical protein HOLleu_21239 [Holothuria leucospilota]|uniref:Uncharacterized protein n=1 Tax=Holothuria leucospilota TaxID=206669 RepID=A0A9Q1BW51_HOLLE|nr:hypothetical protein HOLleu_21239 [Holothuria leucospilota]